MCKHRTSYETRESKVDFENCLVKNKFNWLYFVEGLGLKQGFIWIFEKKISHVQLRYKGANRKFRLR